MTIYVVDFDGTCVTHDYPGIGRPIGAAPVLKALTDRGDQIVLFTMRSGQTLNDAVKWFEENRIPLHGINHNPDQRSWTSSPKAYGHVYIDDCGLGCPLVKVSGQRPYVDWNAVKKMLLV